MLPSLPKRPTRAEIDLSAIRHNVLALRSLLAPSVKFCAVVKADAYGHGAIAVAQQAIAAGADYLSVAMLDEALQLRSAGFSGPILVMGRTPLSEMSLVAENALTQSVFDFMAVESLQAAAAAFGVKAKVHIKIDTGMNRLGLDPSEAADFTQKIKQCPNLVNEGIFTHFATADSADKTSALKQLEIFNKTVNIISARGHNIEIKHCANSAALLNLPQSHLNMVRSGISLCGYWPSEECERTVTLRPAMRFKSKIIRLKKSPPGSAISYGGTFITQKESLIATIPVGYADGWNRRLSGKTKVLIAGQKAPIVGRICMDYCMADVSEIKDVKIGDDVTLFGDEGITVEEVAANLGTINYEVLCMVGQRVARIYRP